MTSPRFYIIIPTRERAETLVWSVRTCLAQDYPDLRVIVSDNCSTDGTRQAIEALGDSRVEYVNTGRRVSMSENWEFALSHVRDPEAFVTCLGDDDGLLPGSLTVAASILVSTGSNALAWRRCPYFWPQNVDPDYRNLMIVPLRDGVVRLQSAETIKDVLSFRREYFELPLIYNSLIRVSTILAIKAIAGKFFCSSTPDVYSGFAVAAALDSYMYSREPFSIEGVSKSSNGMLLCADPKNAAKASSIFLGENSIPFHPLLHPCPTSIPILVAEAFFQARDIIPALSEYSITVGDVMKAAAKSSERAKPYQYGLISEAIKIIGQKNGLNELVAQLASQYPNRPWHQTRFISGTSSAQSVMMLYCDQFYVRNVYEASLLCRHALTLRKSKYQTPVGWLRSNCLQVLRQFAKRFGWPRSMLSSGSFE